MSVQGSLTRSDLWFESSLLDKLLYKSKNQHRSSKHFQRLQEVSQLFLLGCSLNVLAKPPSGPAIQVRRLLKLLKGLQLAELIAELSNLAASSSMGMSSGASVVMYSR